MKYQHIQISQSGEAFQVTLESSSLEKLPQNEVLIKISYSGLNYKDALSSVGNKGITRNFPHTPGIDLAGEVVEDETHTFQVGDTVICTGFDLGMNTSGGLSEYARVPKDWIVPLPKTLSLKEAMIYGTAGFTAGLAVYKMLRNGQTPEMGPIVITGSTGGVGSMAIKILKKMGFETVAVTSKVETQKETLLELGAADVIATSTLLSDPQKPLQKPLWAGGIDNLGGENLVSILKATKKEGSVASIGMASSIGLNGTVFPFILNGVNLLGINSADAPWNIRKAVWGKLADEWKPKNLEKYVFEISLEESITELKKMFEGKSFGKKVVSIR